MTTAIFGLRFKSNESLQPGAAELAAFLDGPREPGKPERHRDDLAAYVRFLERIEAYEAGNKQGTGAGSFGERMFLGVLSHCRFFTPALRIAVEEYKFHHHQLGLLDFRKPLAFIRSAEAETGKLNPKKKDDQQRIERFQAMIEQRRRDLDALAHRRAMRAGELYHIAVYVQENLVRIRQLGEAAIGRLAELQVGGQKRDQLVEDLKAHFKDQVRIRLLSGPVTKEYLEALKTEVADLTQALSRLMLEDLYAVTGIYEQLHDHVQQHTAELEKHLPKADAARKRNDERGWEAFSAIGKALVALVGRFPAAPAAAPPSGGEGGHAALLMEKRREMLDHVLDLLKDAGGAWKR